MQNFILSEDNCIKKVSNDELDGTQKIMLKVVTNQEFVDHYSSMENFKFVERQLRNIVICKVDMMKNCIVGTMAIPDAQTPRRKKADFGFIIYKDTLVFIDDSDFVVKQLDEFMEVQIMSKTSAPHILFEFFEFIINGSMNILYEYQTSFQKLEDKIINTEVFDSKKTVLLEKDFLFAKRRISVFENYYQQLIDLGTYIEENQNGMLANSDCRLFSLFVQRIDRYYDMTLNLKEYVSQINDMYKSKINARQNKIMQTLTVVTSIFMPLTLVAGWYGMNFKIMPELSQPMGYFVVIAVCAAIIVGELIYFKHKKWF